MQSPLFKAPQASLTQDNPHALIEQNRGIMSWQFQLDFKVRDYELDLLGMVNNGIYQGYLEHCRHEFLNSVGLDFAHMHEKGWRLVVTRAELDYKQILQSGDRFTVFLNLNRHSKTRFHFEQEIRKTDGSLVMQAKIIGTSLNERGRPKVPTEIEELFQNHSPEEPS